MKRPGSVKRICLALSGDIICVFLSLLITLSLPRMSGDSEVYTVYFFSHFISGVITIPFICFLMRQYQKSVREMDISDIVRLGFSMCLGYACFTVFNFFHKSPLSLQMLLVFFISNTAAWGFWRMAVRYFYLARSRYILKLPKSSAKKIIIMGAGDAGMYLFDMLSYDATKKMRVVAYIDDNHDLWGKYVKGVRVFGGRTSIPAAVKAYEADEIIISIPHVDNSTIREIYGFCRDTACTVRRFANMSKFNETNLSKATISEVKVEDLLGRSEVSLDMQAVRSMIQNNVVMVTGGAGSIGSELCRQSLAYGAGKLIIFDFNENGLYEIADELSAEYEGRFITCLGSVRSTQRLEEVINEYRPVVIFHAAAHKHVPMMELNPLEAIINNVFGTLNTAKSAMKYDVSKFILISTDKAVNPTNVMGASKRLAEFVIKYSNGLGNTEFAAVRFGNVLGSNGSVIPKFKRQIEAGGPITVTHRDIRRYFMTIREAVQLVMEAGAMATGGELYVLDMGEPVSIYELAKTMIHLSGLVPDKDISIQITGLRPGEKLYEEISFGEEEVSTTANSRIFVLKDPDSSAVITNFDRYLATLETIVKARNISALFSVMKTLIPTFSSSIYKTQTPLITNMILFDREPEHDIEELTTTRSG